MVDDSLSVPGVAAGIFRVTPLMVMATGPFMEIDRLDL